MLSGITNGSRVHTLAAQYCSTLIATTPQKVSTCRQKASVTEDRFLKLENCPLLAFDVRKRTGRGL